MLRRRSWIPSRPEPSRLRDRSLWVYVGRTGASDPTSEHDPLQQDRCKYGNECARVDSNHHGPLSPQGPQPWTPAPYASARVQIVRYVRVRGHIGRIGRNDICQRFVTLGCADVVLRCIRVGECLGTPRRCSCGTSSSAGAHRWRDSLGSAASLCRGGSPPRRTSAHHLPRWSGRPTCGAAWWP